MTGLKLVAEAASAIHRAAESLPLAFRPMFAAMLRASADEMTSSVSQPVVPPRRYPVEARRDQLIAFLTANGPATRAQIMAGSNIPEGSLFTVLRKYKTDFVSVGHGVWDVARGEVQSAE